MDHEVEKTELSAEVNETSAASPTEQNSPRGLIALLIAIAVIGLALALVFGRSFRPAAAAAPAASVPVADPAPHVEQPEARQAITLDTPVGTLVYPEEWGALVTATDVSANGTYAVQLSGEANGEQVPLFTLSVGSDGQGYLLGTAPDASGAQQEIRLDIRALEQEPGWDEDTFLRLNTEQACVNDLIEQINALEGFVPGE